MTLFVGDIATGFDILVNCLQMSSLKYVVAREGTEGKPVSGILIPQNLTDEFVDAFNGNTPKGCSRKIKAPTRNPILSVREAAGLLRKSGSLRSILNKDSISSDETSQDEPPSKKSRMNE